MRLVFMGTPDFSVPSLQALIKNHQVVAVFTQPDRPVGRGRKLAPSPVKELALEAKIPVFQPEKVDLAMVEAFHPEVIVVVAYGQILKKNLLNFPSRGCINIHASLLPRWRGAAPIQWSILKGDLETGVTTQWMAEKLDAGDILLQKKLKIDPNESGEGLYRRLARLGADAILDTLEQLDSLPRQKQDESQVTYAPKLTKDMERLNPFTCSAQELERQVRAFFPWPGTSVDVGFRLKIKKVKAHPNLVSDEGVLFEKTGMLLLGTQRGALELEVVQQEGKKEVKASQFLETIKDRLPLKLR